MMFEEQFPSLNNDTRYCPYPLENVSAFHVEAIKEHCLDKNKVIQGVREELKKYRKSFMDTEKLSNVILLKSGCSKEDLSLNGDLDE